MNCLFSNRKRKFHSSKTRLVVVVAVSRCLRGRMAETRVAGLSITQFGRGYILGVTKLVLQVGEQRLWPFIA